ncbi:MAG: hypothetical protein ACP5LT_09100 [Candidatus Kapaibacteriota bacterium]
MNCILDTSEWVVQLVRASDNQVLWTIDSVGFLPNNNCPYAIAYGIQPYRINHIRNLPDEFSGIDVYIRISIRRWGPTTFGMLLAPVVARANLSAFQEYAECDSIYRVLGYKCKFDWKRFNHFYYEKVVEYLDSIVAAKNRQPLLEELPPNLYFMFSDSNYTAKIFNRYYQYDTTHHIWKIPSDSTESGLLPRSFDPSNFSNNFIINDSKEKYTIKNIEVSHEGNKTVLKIIISQRIYRFPEQKESERSEFSANLYTIEGALINTQKYQVRNGGDIEMTLIASGRLAKGVYFVTIWYPETSKPISKYVLVR